MDGERVYADFGKTGVVADLLAGDTFSRDDSDFNANPAVSG